MTTALQPERPVAPNVDETMRTASFSVRVDRELLTQHESQRAAGETVDERIPLVFSSEYPVERYDWWEGERYLEILDHSSAAIDLSRALRGLPFCDTHNMYSLAAQLGRVEDVKLRADGKLGGMLRLSRKKEAQDYRQDLLDGITGEVSVGYKIDPTRVDRITAEGQLTQYIVRRWTPHEVSGVPVPADPTVGVNRSGSTPPAGALPRPMRTEPDVSARASDTTSSPDAPNGQEPHTMDPVQESGAPASGGTTVVVNRTEAPDLDARRRNLAELADKHGVTEVFSRGVAAGKDLDAVSSEMMTVLKERVSNGPQFGAPVTLTEKEERQYSLARAMLSSTDDTKCFEREVSESIEKNLPQGYERKGTGLLFPTNLGSRTVMVQGTSSIGGALTFVQPGSFIDLLRNKCFILQAGATMLPGLRSSVSFPKQTGAGTFYWVGESPASDVTESNLTFSLVSLTPKTGAATQAFSRQLLVQAEFVPQIEQLVRNDLAAIHARAIDLAAIAGSGSANQPLGLTASTLVGTVTVGANGGVPTYDLIVDQEVQIRNGNVDGSISYMTTPTIAGKLKKTQVFSSTDGTPVWTGDLINGTLNGAKAFATKQIPSNLTKGTSTTACSAIIAGAFENLLVGEFGAAEIITDVTTLKKKGLIEVTSFQMIDVAWRHDGAFSLILDAKPA